MRGKGRKEERKEGRTPCQLKSGLKCLLQVEFLAIFDFLTVFFFCVKRGRERGEGRRGRGGEGGEEREGRRGRGGEGGEEREGGRERKTIIAIHSKQTLIALGCFPNIK